MATVYLLKSILENDYKQTYHFESRDEQKNHFLREFQPKLYEDLNYQRKNNVIRIPDQYDDVVGYNYVMYKNDGSDKWYYAFITDIQYVSEGRTDIFIETDVIQTWYFDYDVGESFVEREHTDNDTIGANTVPENLELGEYICQSYKDDENLRDVSYVILSTISPVESQPAPRQTNIGGIPYAGGVYFTKDVNEIGTFAESLEGNETSDAIYGVYIIPDIFLKADSEGHISVLTHRAESTNLTKAYTVGVKPPEKFGIYKPHNNKLFTFPYCYLLLSNNSGSANVLQFEHFNKNDSGECEFDVKGIGTLGGSIKCVPKWYKGILYNEEEGIMLGKYPICSWSKDLFTNWMTQNSVNIGVGVATGVLQVVAGAATAVGSSGMGAGFGVSAVISGVSTIGSALGQVYQHTFTPPSAEGNVNGGDINTASRNNVFKFYTMSIKTEYARLIDEYFTMYGYKVNRIKKPNTNHRRHHWFIKTVDVNIDPKLSEVNGDITGYSIPVKDMKKIKDCYNNGISFYRASESHSVFYNSGDNPII